MKNKITKSLPREKTVLFALIFVVLIFTILDTSYLTIANIVDILKQATINGIIAIGMTFAIISGGIDLSVGCTFAITIVAVGELTVLGVPPLLAIIIGIGIGIALGYINGILVTKLNLQPFIATLATMSAYRGVAYVVTGGWPVLGIPTSYRMLLGKKLFLNIPIYVFVFFVVAILAHVLLKKTRYGNYLVAVGSNEEAAKLSGLNVNRIKVVAYSITGACAALAGMIMLASLGTGEPASGTGYELDAIAAAAIGGTRMAGGRGTALGTVLGALFLAALKIGLIIVGVDTFWQYIVTGIIIAIAAYLETMQDKLTFSAAKASVK
ncbi:MAG: ABC transporter permease [Sphaerochaeta sp.]